jgi:hypothetical protein
VAYWRRIGAEQPNCRISKEPNSKTFPPLYPPALSRPAGRERELTAICGQRFELKKYQPFGLYLIGELQVMEEQKF